MLIFTCVVGLPMRVIHMGRRVFIFVSTSVVADAWRPENHPQELQRALGRAGFIALYFVAGMASSFCSMMAR